MLKLNVHRVSSLLFKLSLVALLCTGCVENENKKVNFAFGGAMSNQSNATGIFSPEVEVAVKAADLSLIGLTQQLEFAKHTLGPVAPNSDLFWIWIGTNDYIAGQTDPSVVARKTVEAMGYLRANFGARHFVVPNLMPMGNLPLIKSFGAEAVAKLNAITPVSNQKLSEAIADFKAKNRQTTVTEVDVYRLFAELSNNESFVNHTEDCLTVGVPTGADCNTWVYFDNVHFSAPVAKLLADRVFEDLLITHNVRVKMFTRLIAFGDSFTDKGMHHDTILRATGTGFPPSPPYYQGRFCNGPNTIDRLEELLNIKPNQFYPQPTGAEWIEIKK